MKRFKLKFVPKVACVSGYFDPLHVGHLEYLKKAKKHGIYLIVIVNNDAQAALKKGKSFMPEKERVEILKELKCVNQVVLSIDKDRTVCETLRSIQPKPHFFCNGGDQNNESIPEAEVCKELGIELIDALNLVPG
jgi:cytidyltransferase-like protein